MDRRIEDIIDFIDKNLGQHISLRKASQEANLSYTYFSALFKKETGKRFVEYLIEKRIAKAQSLLGNPRREIKEMYYSIGYRNIHSFYRDFKKITRLTPGEYMEQEKS